jgi:flagellar basal body P-ring formation protein FlgA
MDHSLMMAIHRLVLSALYFSLASVAHAQGLSDRDKEVIEAFVEKHPSMQDKSHVVRFIDSLAEYPPCDGPIDVKPPIGRDKLWGTVNLAVECQGIKTYWQRSVPIRVVVFGTYAVTARNLPPGRTLQPEDYVWIEGEVTGMAGQLVDYEGDLESVETVRPLSHGAPIRLNDIRPIAVIKRGEVVKLTILGKGFAVETSASALGNAKMGDFLQVRTKEGKVITALATGRGEAQVRVD